MAEENTMPELIHQHASPLFDSQGRTYTVVILGEPRTDGTWEGWIEFHPADSERAVLRTARETSQPNREALAYWATGLEPVYLEGAFARAQ